jgi:LysR family glycine cleavage system transcriptional activator
MQSLRTKLPPINSLVAFEACARHCSFTRAGQEMMISREAVSRQIRILEGHLGTKLFVRLYRAVELTAAGEELQSVVAESLENIASVAINLKRLNQPSKIVVTATVAITSFWLMPRLPRFRAENPETEIRVNVSDTPIDMRAEGIDVGLKYGDGHWSGLKATHLFDVKSFPVCSPGYLESAGPIETPHDLQDQTLLYLDGSMHSLETWTWWLEKFDEPRPETARTLWFDNYANVIQAALDGQGVALGFTHIISDLLSQGLLVRPMDLTCSKGQAVYLVVPRGSMPTPSVQKFSDWIISEANSSVE